VSFRIHDLPIRSALFKYGLSPMSLAKTDRARQALKGRSADLSPRERQALVLCDGKRRLNDLQSLLGSEALTLLTGLMERGYLDDLARSSPAPLAKAQPPSRPALAPAVPVSTPASAAPHAVMEAPRQRRSMAATKMYMIDLLQLMRDSGASSLAVSIQTSADEIELVYHLLDSLRYIAGRAEPSYVERVGERIAQILPESYLEPLEATLAEVLAGRSTVA